MTTPLQAVSPLPQRPLTFRDRAIAALETHQGADLVAYLAKLHDDDMNEVVGQAAAARGAVVDVATAAGIDAQQLAHVLAVVQPLLRRSGENAVRAGHFAGRVEAVRAVINEAGPDGRVDAEAVRDVLDTKPLPAPFRPIALGVTPATHYRVGHFRHVHTNEEIHLPFVGYSLCEDHPDRPMTSHMTFLHDGAAMPRPRLYAEHGLVLQHVE
jgi:hypothetical protein